MNQLRNIFNISIAILFTYGSYAQNELDPYKYIIVPKKYEFLKKENQYRVNSYMKHLFEKEGYSTVYQGENYPDDLLENPCLGIKAMVSDDSSAFTTKVYIFLENCRDEVVFRTEQGKSKVKDMNKTYVDALNRCFEEIKSIDYTYDPALVVNTGRKQESKIDQSEEYIVTSVKATEGINDKPQVSETNQNIESEAAAVVTPSADPAVVPVTAVVAADVASKEPAQGDTAPEKEKNESSPMARAFENETISFLLVDQGAQLQAFVSHSKNVNYKPGELIGTFKKTSLPNVFRVSWKKPQEGREETTAYFDEAGNLNVDVLKDGQIQVIKFEEVK